MKILIKNKKIFIFLLRIDSNKKYYLMIHRMEENKLTTFELGAKAQSKNEVYRLLVTDAGLHLPPMKESHYDYLAGVLCGDIKYLKNNQVKAKIVPMVDGLRVKDILQFAREHSDIEKYLPSYKKNKVPDRSFLCNVVNTLIPEKFERFIQEVMSKREKMLIKKRRMEVDALPEFKNIIRMSKHVSYEKGKTNILVRKTRKRKYFEMEHDERDAWKKKFDKETEVYQEEISLLKNQIKELNILKLENEVIHEKLQALYDSGIIDANFEPADEMK